MKLVVLWIVLRFWRRWEIWFGYCCVLIGSCYQHPVPTSTPLKNRYSHPIPSFCYVVEKKRRHILPICHFLCFFFISINLNNSMHFLQSSKNKYLYLLLFQSHCRWDSLFQTCLSFPVFQSRYRMRLSILQLDTDRTGVSWEFLEVKSTIKSVQCCYICIKW